jgi:predicted transposase YbfD/YdcC
LKYLDCKKDWTGIKSVAKIYSKRIDKQTGKESQETRYYISSLNAKARKIASAVRSHWSIENLLHWNLDVIFKEDSSLKKCGDSALNYNIIAKIALTIIDKEKSTKKSKPIKRQWAALDDHYREFLLNV